MSLSVSLRNRTLLSVSLGSVGTRLHITQTVTSRITILSPLLPAAHRSRKATSLASDIGPAQAPYSSQGMGGKWRMRTWDSRTGTCSPPLAPMGHAVSTSILASLGLSSSRPTLSDGVSRLVWARLRLPLRMAVKLVASSSLQAETSRPSIAVSALPRVQQVVPLGPVVPTVPVGPGRACLPRRPWNHHPCA